MSASNVPQGRPELEMPAYLQLFFELLQPILQLRVYASHLGLVRSTASQRFDLKSVQSQRCLTRVSGEELGQSRL